MTYPEDHFIFAEHPEVPVETDTLIINQYFNVDVFAKQIGLCKEDLIKINPSIHFATCFFMISTPPIHFARLCSEKSTPPIHFASFVVLIESRPLAAERVRNITKSKISVQQFCKW